MSTYYNDIHGREADIFRPTADIVRLIIRDHAGHVLFRKDFPTVRAARSAMARFSDCWRSLIDMEVTP